MLMEMMNNADELYLLIGKYIYFYNKLERKVKEKYMFFFSENEKSGTDLNYLSSLKTLLYLFSKTDKFSFKYLKINSESIDIFKVRNTTAKNITLNQIISLHKDNQFSNINFDLFCYTISRDMKFQIDIGTAFYKLMILRNKLAHMTSINILGEISDDDVSNSMVIDLIDVKYQGNDYETLACNIFWMEKVLIPFLDNDKFDQNFQVDKFYFEFSI